MQQDYVAEGILERLEDLENYPDENLIPLQGVHARR
jgi:hypothetical protein